MKRLQPLAPILKKGIFVVLWLNSPPQQVSLKLAKRLWNEGAFRACTDGAANNIMPLVKDKSCSKPNLISGDFDSITNETKEFFKSQDVAIIKTEDQDYTDMCKALRIIGDKIDKKELNASGVVVLGGIFGRFDHVLSSLHSLLRFHKYCMGCEAVLFDGANLVTILGEGSTEVDLTGGRHLLTGKCGVVPFVQRKTVVTSTGLQWNLDNTELAYGKLISTSNEITSDTISIKTTEPLIFTAELSEKALN